MSPTEEIGEGEKVASVSITQADVGTIVPVKGSAARELTKEDVVKSLRDLGFLIGAVALAYAAHWLKIADFGEWGPVLVPLIGGAIDIGRRWLKNNQRIDLKDILD